MVIYEKPIPVKAYKQNFDELELFCRHNQDMEILLKEWVPLEVVMHVRQKYGSQLIVPNIGQVLTEIFTKMIDEAAFRKRTNTKAANPTIVSELENRTLMGLMGFLGKDPLRMVVNDIHCLLRYYSGKKDIDF